jgi:acetyl esterase
MPTDPQVQGILDYLAASGRGGTTALDPGQSRAGYLAMAAMTAHPEVRPAIGDRTVPGPAGDLAARVYRPDGEGPFPVVLYLHGGGWVLGGIATADGICQQLAVGVPAVVVSLEYRLAPEDPFPAAVDDAEAALRWVADHAADLGGDPDRLAVAGDSAGANLAAVVARRARDAGGPPVAFQLLLCPVTDATCSQPSYAENGEGYMLTAGLMRWMIDNYLDGADPADPDVSPLLAHDLAGLPPTLVVTAEYDPLRDEGEAYAARLRGAGVEAVAVRYDGMIHAFLDMTAVVDAARPALEETIGALRDALATSTG